MSKRNQAPRGPTDHTKPRRASSTERQGTKSLAEVLLGQLALVVEETLQSSPQASLWPENTPILSWLLNTISMAEHGRHLRQQCEPLIHMQRELQQHIHTLEEQLRTLRKNHKIEESTQNMRKGLERFHQQFEGAIHTGRSLQRYLQSLRHQHNNDPQFIYKETFETFQSLDNQPPPSLEELQHRILSATHEAFLGQLTRYMIHDLGSPASYLLSNLSAGLHFLREAEQMPDEDLDFSLSDLWMEIHTILDDTREGIVRIQDIMREQDVWQRNSHDTTRSPLIPVESLISLTLRMTRPRSEHVIIDMEPGLLLQGDRGQLSQILINLINNAIDAQERADRPPSFSVRARGRSKHIEISVSNEGPPIPANLQDKIFDPFFTTDPQSHSGLGLIICRTLAERHHGTILMRSNERRTTFTLRLPRPQ